MKLTVDFTELNMSHLPIVGGKNASLGEMITHLSELNIHVPNGFATTVDAYNDFLKSNLIDEKIHHALDKIDINNIHELKQASDYCQKLILDASFSNAFENAIDESYQRLALDASHSVAVRSSATAEDLKTASFAGQQETYLNISGFDNILIAIKKVFASLFTPRAISYRVLQGFDHSMVGISAGIQKMVRSDCGSSGVMFTIDTESGFDQVIFITASYGLGELIVQGSVNPDEFYVHKPTLCDNKAAIISRKLGTKLSKMIYEDNKDCSVKVVNTEQALQQQFSLNDHDILTLAKCAFIIEKHYGQPMDIEWAKDGIDQKIYILQARPETVSSRLRDNQTMIEQYYLSKKEKPIAMGRSIGQKIGQGIARIILDLKDMNCFQEGEVLVTEKTDPDWEPIMKRASAIVTNHGGRTCHAAIIAREMGIPAVVGCGNATTLIQNNGAITVSCAEGETGYVYPDFINFHVEKTEINDLPTLPFKLCMNLANPEQAFTHQFLPNDGIGLARIEFIISNMIGIHPNAILNPEKTDKKTQIEINHKIAAYQNPREFYIEKLAEGIATIASAFYPKPIIVRFSDFKSNEYANLLGGEFFELKEENPMIGYRGASRYISGHFQACFSMECEAIRRVRELKGLTNTHVMFPFVRTLSEAEKCIMIAKENGLTRGENDLKIYMMCEIPSNALLAESFLALFDGYSIGSNDLTQLTLGLDRDSELVADLFDERNAAVKILLQQIIQTCKKLNKYVGICGQGPSDHPDFAKWLVEQGIDSLSLTPDSIVKTWILLSDTK